MNEKRTRGVPASPDQRRIRAGFAAIASNWRFWIIVVFAALPAKLLLTGFLFFQVPLFLTDLGSSQSEIGRIVMLYGIVALVAVPVCAHWADRLDAHGFAVGLGGLLAGGALLLILSELPPSLVIIIAVAVFGLGQALTLSSLIAVVTRVATHDLSGPRLDSALAAYRLVERLGAAAGPVLAAFLVTRYGHVVAMALTGAIGFITCLIFSVLMMTGGYAPEPEIRTGDFQIADRP